MTAERIGKGTCLLALDGNEIVGTVMLYPQQEDSECAYYGRPGVFHFGKFAVLPERQGDGIGKMLFEAVESEAKRLGARELACDTAKPASDLIAMYRRWGLEIVGEQNWSITNYESVVMSKLLAD